MSTHPVTPSGTCNASGPPVDVVTWRWCRLLEAGFPADLARQLSSSTSIDLHALLELVDRGCPAELAARILSPVLSREWAP